MIKKYVQEDTKGNTGIVSIASSAKEGLTVQIPQKEQNTVNVQKTPNDPPSSQ